MPLLELAQGLGGKLGKVMSQLCFSHLSCLALTSKEFCKIVSDFAGPHAGLMFANARVLIFGCHNVHPIDVDGLQPGEEKSPIDAAMRMIASMKADKNPFDLRVCPNPILEMSISNLSCDSSSGIRGNAISFLNDVVAPPPQLGRLCPAVCKLSDGRVFYCGGQYSTPLSGLVKSQEIYGDERRSKVTAFFSLNSRKWERVSDMLVGVSSAVACQAGNHILVIGGEVDGNRFVRLVQCFDLITNRWLHAQEHGYEDKKLPGASSIAIAKLSDGRIIAAGGNYSSGWHETFGPLVDWHSGMEILDPLSRQWRPLPSMTHDEPVCGIVLSNGQFAVLSKSFFDSFNANNGTWERLESSGMRGDVSSVCRVGASAILAICSREARVYDERLRRWLPLPLQTRRQWGAEVGLQIENRGEPFMACLVATKAISMPH